MTTIFVSGASGIIGYGILRSLRKNNPNYRLVGTTIHERSAARVFCDVFEVAPPTSDASYVPWLVDLIKRLEISIAVPGIEDDVIAWNEHREVIEKAGAVVLLNNPDLIRLCADKWSFYRRLVESSSPYAIPTSLRYDKALGEFPLLAKPRRGSGSKGMEIVKDMERLDALVEIGDSRMIFQPIIGCSDEEYTCSAFFDMSSRLCSFISMKRTLSTAGFTEIAETVDQPDVDAMLIHLADIFKPIGPTNFQVRMDKGQLRLLEINPRISSATSIRTAFGYNESAMGVDLFLNGVSPRQPRIKRGYAVRYTEDMVYYDSADI